MNSLLLEGKAMSDCEIITARNIRTNELETIAQIEIEGLVKAKPAVYHTQIFQTSDLDLLSIMADIKAGDHVIAQGIMYNFYDTKDGHRAPKAKEYYAICTSVKIVGTPLAPGEECMSSLIIEGKATSDCAHEEKHYANATVDMHQITIVSQVQGEQSLDCQLQMQAYDPDITFYMSGVEKGDRVLAIGKPATKYWDTNRTTPTFRYGICETVKKWNQ